MAEAVFDPVAILGRGCVLPGARSASDLWRAVLAGDSLIGPPPPGRTGLAPSAETALIGGYVSGVAGEEALPDAGTSWLAEAARQALAEAGHPTVEPMRFGVIIGNLGYPTRALADLAGRVWERRPVSARDAASRHNTGGPARALARRIGAQGPAFAVDAACASSLYALRLACDRLHSGELDMVLAGGLNGADPLILQRGFAALRALSPTGRSRPLAEGADGLVPAEGAACVVLMRRRDVPENARVFGLIRGIGLSNDGRRKGLLVPDAQGQVEAMQAAWSTSGLDPREAGLIEAHATGTPVGDGVEIGAMQAFFGADGPPLPVGSLKSNTGHLITAAGLASLIKMSFALDTATLAPTRLDGPALPALAGTRLRPQTAPEPWPGAQPRLAAISNFGFGGNNAHLVLSADVPPPPAPTVPPLRPALAIAGIGLQAGRARGVDSVVRALSRPAPPHPEPAEAVRADPVTLRTPPSDLKGASAQQLAVFDVVGEALQGVRQPAPERIGVFVGFRCAPESARWAWAERAGIGAPAIAALSAADVTGAMPNVSANRLNAAHDWRGPGFAVMAEEDSGAVALDLAARALRAGEIDMAVVAAADFAAEPVEQAVAAAIGHTHTPGDGAVALVLQRAGDAGPSAAPLPDTLAGPAPHPALSSRFGVAPATGPLTELAVTTALARRGLALGETGAHIEITGAEADRAPIADPLRPVPCLSTYAADTPEDLLAAIEADRQGETGRHRLALTARNEEERHARRFAALAHLRGVSAASQPESLPKGLPEGLWQGEGEPAGALAFLFTGAAAAQRGMGRELIAAFPEIAPRLAARFSRTADGAAAALGDLSRPIDQLRATSFLSQAHHTLLTEGLRLEPTVAMGLSSGETNALIAFGAWPDPDALMHDIAQSGMYERDLGGAFETARAHFGAPVAGWENWRIFAPVEAIRAAIAGLPRLHLAILYTPADAVIAGPPADCAQALRALPGVQAVRVSHDLIVHTPALGPYAQTWRTLHTRPTTPPPGVRFYANATGSAYVPDAASAADRLTRQALDTVDWPATVARAFADGVRTFVELGPRATLSEAVAVILAGQPGVTAVATHRTGRGEVEEIANLAAALFAAGHRPAMGWLRARLDALRATLAPPAADERRLLTLPAHLTLPEPAPMPPLQPPFPVPPPRPDLIWPAARPRREAPRAARPLTPLARLEPTGLPLTREQLEFAAEGPLSALFGPEFAGQDGFDVVVRMPRPPLLLCDRVIGIDAPRASLGKGVIWTETDVRADHWAVWQGFLRPGTLIEAGQADLLLISFMGIDAFNRGERVYRLLGCEMTFHPGGLPQAGETLRFQIHITGHSELNGVRLFFFEYDCYASGRLLLSVRSGQAGFFTPAELAEARGVLWDAASADPPTPPERARRDGHRPSTKRAFTAADINAFRAGDALACFGPGFERAAAHTRPPGLPGGRLALFDSVAAFDPDGGPWKRGYLRALQHVPTDAWFYDGHFHNDPCMPGTLMAEAALQALAFMAAAMGLTIERDGCVFEPVDGEAAQFVCRGQVVPDRPHAVEYEIFLDEITGGPRPAIWASVLATSDGLKVFWCPRIGLRLRPHWPALAGPDTPARLVGGDVRGDTRALIEMALGAPSRALGSLYAPFDHGGRVARLPAPPYHFLSRIVHVDAPPGQGQAGVSALAQYDVPPQAWYFRQSGNGAMPLAVLTEIALQPCGWLAGYTGLAAAEGIFFRNLDGKGRVLAEIGPDAGTLSIAVRLTRISRAGPLVVVAYEVAVTDASGAAVMDLETSFGFFTAEALAGQAGLKVSDAQRAALEAPAGAIPDPAGPMLALPEGRLRMVDRIDGFEPQGGAAGLGRIRARQTVDPHAWYFRAHFFADPVQPGSLGLDALAQALTHLVRLRGLADGFARPRLQVLAPGEAVRWSYRGQVTPAARDVTTIVDILAIENAPDARLIRAAGSLWVDGLRIYEMDPFAVRLVEAAPGTGPDPGLWQGHVSPALTPWLDSHRPTHTLPALPLLAMAGMVMRTQGAAFPLRLEDFAPHAWAIVPEGGLDLTARAEADGRVTLAGRSAADDDAAPVRLASGRIAAPVSDPFRLDPPGPAARTLPDLYAQAELFHGPALHMIVAGRRDAAGFEVEVALDRAATPGDAFDPALLDALVHAVPHQSPQDWFPGLEGMVIYPVRILSLTLFGPPPASGTLHVRGSVLPGAVPPAHLPIRVEAWTGAGPFAVLELVEKAYPRGRFGALDRQAVRAFIRGEAAEPFAPLSDGDAQASWLSPAKVSACDWLPGTVAAIYGAPGLTGTALVQAVAVKEHFARLWRLHPRDIDLDETFARHPDGRRARYRLAFDRERRAWRVEARP